MEAIPEVAPTVTAVLVLMSIPMAIAVGVKRARTGILLLHGQDEDLLRLMRAHGRFVEYVPLVLLAVGCAGIGGAAPWLIAGCGAVLVLVRVIRYFGLRASAESKGRAIVAGLAAATMQMLALAILWQLEPSA